MVRNGRSVRSSPRKRRDAVAVASSRTAWGNSSGRSNFPAHPVEALAQARRRPAVGYPDFSVWHVPQRSGSALPEHGQQPVQGAVEPVAVGQGDQRLGVVGLGLGPRRAPRGSARRGRPSPRRARRPGSRGRPPACCAPLAGKPSSPAAASSASREPKRVISDAAVFSPIPATPGSPSEGSPSEGGEVGVGLAGDAVFRASPTPRRPSAGSGFPLPCKGPGAAWRRRRAGRGPGRR